MLYNVCETNSFLYIKSLLRISVFIHFGTLCIRVATHYTLQLYVAVCVWCVSGVRGAMLSVPWRGGGGWIECAYIVYTAWRRRGVAYGRILYAMPAVEAENTIYGWTRRERFQVRGLHRLPIYIIHIYIYTKGNQHNIACTSAATCWPTTHTRTYIYSRNYGSTLRPRFTPPHHPIQRSGIVFA